MKIKYTCIAQIEREIDIPFLPEPEARALDMRMVKELTSELFPNSTVQVYNTKAD